MTEEGRLARGKANYEAGKFLKNSETVAYAESIKETPAQKKAREKAEAEALEAAAQEAEDAKSNE